MDKKSKTLTLYPKKRKIILCLLASIFFGLLGYLTLNDGSGTLIGIGVISFSLLGCIVFTIELLPNSTYLHLSEEGFDMHSLFKKNFIHRDKIAEFKIIYIHTVIFVGINFKDTETKYTFLKNISNNIIGAQGSLPDTYGKSAEELADLLNKWRKKYSKK